MQEHDKIVKVIGDKLRDYEAGEASDADWEAFRAAMPVQKKKKRIGFWFFVPFIFLGSALFAYVLFFKQEPITSKKSTVSAQNEVVSSIVPEINSAPSSKKLVNKKSEIESIELTSNTSITSSPVLSNTKTSSRSSKKNVMNTASPVVRIEKSEKSKQRPPYNVNQTPVFEIKELSKNNIETSGLNQGLFKASVLNEKNKNVIAKNKVEVNSLNVEATNIKDSSAKSTELVIDTNQVIVSDKKLEAQPIMPVKVNALQLKHFDLNAMYSPGFVYLEQNISSNPMLGMGIALAYRVKKQWYVSSGIQYMFARTQSRIQKEVPIEYATISKIDTSLKFDLASSTIMMNIDTHYQNHAGIRNDEYLIVRKSQVISIPVLFGYSLGNHRTELSLFGGVQNDWLMEEFTKSHALNKTTETQTKQIYLPAPMIGFAFGKGFSGNWSMNLGMDYRYYLSDNLTKKDFWRLQAGFRFHIK